MADRRPLKETIKIPHVSLEDVKKATDLFKKESDNWLKIAYDKYQATDESFPNHVIRRDDMAEDLKKYYPTNSEGLKVDRSPLDRAINYVGGYDWGIGHSRTPEDIERALLGAKAYQLDQYNQATTAKRREDAVKDYLENVAGIKAAIQDNEAGIDRNRQDMVNDAVIFSGTQNYAEGGLAERTPIMLGENLHYAEGGKVSTDDTAIDDYAQLLEAYPNAKKFLASLGANVEKNIPTTQELQNPEVMQQRALGYMSPMAGAIKAYHGSPHSFDKFDMSKIGTGEGAQAYGHGLYFAESPDVADAYRRALSSLHGAQKAEFFDKSGNKLPDIKFGHPEYIARTALHVNEGNYQKAIDQIKNEIKQAEGSSSPFLLSMAERSLKDLKILEDMQKQGVTVSAPKGNLYNVSLEWPDKSREAVDPLSPEHFLDWDKPMSEQSDYVKNILSDAPEIQNLINKQLNWRKEAFDKYPETHPLKEILRGKLNNPYSPSGQKLYEEISKRKANTFGFSNGATSSVDSSEALKELGIPGIKYLDQGSRGVGEGTSNYVVFDDLIPKIVEKKAQGGHVEINHDTINDIMQQFESEYGLRPDGSEKGRGYLNELKRPDGAVMTEYSIGLPVDGVEMDVPTLVPSLNIEEIKTLLNLPERGRIPESIVKKASEHAEKRVKSGKSVWATPEESEYGER